MGDLFSQLITAGSRLVFDTEESSTWANYQNLSHNTNGIARIFRNAGDQMLLGKA